MRQRRSVARSRGSTPPADVRRIILTFKDGELGVHTLYRARDLGPNPGTKARTSLVADLTRRGLQDALEALEGGSLRCVGTSGFTTREDVILATASPDGVALVQGA